MIVRELAAAFGLDIDAQSFAQGDAFVEAAKAGLALVAEGAYAVASAFQENVDAAGGWSGDLAAAAAKTEQHFAEVAKRAATLHEYLAAQLERLWSRVLRYVLPALQTLAAYWEANVKFYGKLFSDAADWIVKNWDAIKIALLVGVTAITAALVVLKWEAVKSAAASAAAWLAAAWPFILLASVIGGLLLLLDDLRVYAEGGDSLFGRWKKTIEGWLSIKGTDPEWLKSIKGWLSSVKESLTQKGAIDALFARVRGWFVSIGQAIAEFFAGPLGEVSDALEGLWKQARDLDWGAVWGELKGDLRWVKEKIESIPWGWVKEQASDISFRSWIAEIKAFLEFLRSAYRTIRGIYDTARLAIALVESGGPAGLVAQRLAGRKSRYDEVKEEIARRDAGEAYRDEIRRAPAGSRPANFVERAPEAAPEPEWARLPNFEDTRFSMVPTPTAAAPPPADQRQYNISVTQRPGEDGEALARRVAELTRADRQAELEEAAAAVPAVE